MNEVKFNSQICTTLEQSERLLDLGLKPETADMSYYILGDDEPVLTMRIAKVYREILKGGKVVEKKYARIIPAWSLHRLMEIGNIENVGFADMKNAYDTCINMIASHIKFGLLNKEYLIQ